MEGFSWSGSGALYVTVFSAFCWRSLFPQQPAGVPTERGFLCSPYVPFTAWAPVLFWLYPLGPAPVPGHYAGLPGNLQGRVCLPFSLVWGLLALVLVDWVHPALVPWLARIPGPVSGMALATLAADGILTALLLRRTGDTACLRWYQTK